MPELLLAVNTPVVVLSFSLYTLAIVAIGLYSARYARRSDEDYFLAGRSLGAGVAALSASASSESGWVTLGLVGIGFGAGVQGYWVIPGCLLGYLFNWFILAGRMNDQARTLNALTLPDFFAFRFRERLPLIRTLAVLVTLAAMMAYVAAQMAAAGKSFGALFDQMRADRPTATAAVDQSEPSGAPPTPERDGQGAVAKAAGEPQQDNRWDYPAGVLLGAAIVLLYTVTGGFRAVCWTDFLQALLMIGALVVFPIYLLAWHGGYAFVFEHLRGVADAAANLPEGHLLDPWGNHTGLALFGFLLGSHALGINFGYPGQPHVLVRFMALRERREARVAGVLAFFWGLCVYWGAVTVGLFARALHEAHMSGMEWTALIKADRELSLVVSGMYMLPGVLSGLVLAAILAAICSTADSQLVVAASSAAHDLYARLFSRSGRSAHLLVNRLVVFGLGVGAVLLVINKDVTIYQYVLNYGWAMLGAAFGPQVVLAVLWRRASYAGCLAGMVTGFALVLVWGEVYEMGATRIEVYNLPLAFVAALVVNIVVSLLAPGRHADGVSPAVDDRSAPPA
jgi:SSS family transporter